MSKRVKYIGGVMQEETNPTQEETTAPSLMQQAVQHAAYCFGDAVDQAVSQLLQKCDITPVMGSLSMDILPPEGERQGWLFTLHHQGQKLGTFEVGVFLSFHEDLPLTPAE